MSKKSGGQGACHTPDPPANNATKRRTHTNETPSTWALGYPPAGKRARWLLVVQRCSRCLGSHGHYTGSQGGVRRRGCGSGFYDLRVRPALAVAR
jgi:hypothetical protein